MMAQQLGLDVPPEISQWLVVILAGCISIFLVQGSILGFSVATGWLGDLRDRKERDERHVRELGLRLSSLTDEEMEILRNLLMGPQVRFEVSVLSPAYAMMEKGVLRNVGLARGNYLCEVDPDIYALREGILQGLVARDARQGTRQG